jgi:flagellar protein FlgJ
MNPLDGASLAFDPRRTAALLGEAKGGDAASLRKVAQEFEALLLQQVLKAARAANPGNEYFDSEATRTFTGMLDEQHAQALSRGRGIGLADLIVRQMELVQGVKKTPVSP